jgi:hypothetical protein
MTIATSRNQRRILEKENAALPLTLQEVPRSEWPTQRTHILRVFRSRNLLVQEYQAPAPAKVRLSICRTSIGNNGRWLDGISWDELQQIKRECGYGDADAVEVFPADADVVNVANMRHLWVMAEPLKFSWKKP